MIRKLTSLFILFLLLVSFANAKEITTVPDDEPIIPPYSEQEGAIEGMAFWCRDSKVVDKIYSRELYWENQYGIHKQKGMTDSALISLEKYLVAHDSVWAYEKSIFLKVLNQKDNYLEIKDANVALLKKQRNLSLYIGLLIVLSLSVFLIYGSRIRRKNEALKKERLDRQRKELELETLKNREYQAKQSLLKRSLIFKKVKMLSELKMSNAEAFKKEVEQILHTSFLKDEDWDEIKSEIDFVYPDFIEKLAERIPKLTEEEIRFCCLLKVGLDTIELSTLLSINPTSVDKRRHRINKKIKEVCPDLNWCEFLQTL